MNDLRTVRVAAVQVEADVGNIEANLDQCASLAEEAVAAGAEWVALPEFFSTGVANLGRIREQAPGPDGAPTRTLREIARRYEVYVGGSTLIRDDDDHVRNAFLLVGPGGELLGRHDKDIPTMWENALYVGGSDPGRIAAGDVRVGVALCWEMMRTQTVQRLEGQVDLILAGSGWWSIPRWIPRRVTGALQAGNERRAIEAASVFAAAVGSPIVHAAHAGPLECPWPPGGLTYRGHYQGGAIVADEQGRIVAARFREEGAGIAVADVTLRRAAPPPPAERFWLQRRGVVAAVCWAYQNRLGRWQYSRAQRARVDRAGVAKAPGGRS